MTNHASILGKASIFGSAPCSKNIDDGHIEKMTPEEKKKPNSATLTNS
jgi:hypothetical protein